MTSNSLRLVSLVLTCAADYNIIQVHTFDRNDHDRGVLPLSVTVASGDNLVMAYRLNSTAVSRQQQRSLEVAWGKVLRGARGAEEVFRGARRPTRSSARLPQWLPASC